MGSPGSENMLLVLIPLRGVVSPEEQRQVAVEALPSWDVGWGRSGAKHNMCG